MEFFIILGYVLFGTLAGGILCLLPSLHIYNVAGIALIIWYNVRYLIPYDAIGPFFLSMVVSYSFVNTITMTFFNAADESAGASMLPSNELVMRGRGKEAVIMSGFGTLLGAFLLLFLTPFFYYVWSRVSKILTPHLHWVIGLVIVFYIMSEWPKGAGRGPTVWAKFKDSWRNVFAGMCTFALASFMGLLYTSKNITSPELSFQSIMPIFVGFFAFPSLIQALLSDIDPPKQYNSQYITANWKDFGYGTFVGFIGGMLAAYLPAVTAGIGALFAGHGTNHRNLQHTEFKPPKDPNTAVNLVTPELYYTQERVFLIGGGVNKIMYYVGAFLFLFVLTDITPFGMGRGGLNILLKPIFAPEKGDYAIMISTIIFSAGLSFLLMLWLTDLTVKHLQKINLKAVYVISMIVVALMIFMIGSNMFTNMRDGLISLGITFVTTCIGMIPVFYACRRSHCMAVLLTPIAFSMAGYGDLVIQILGID